MTKKLAELVGGMCSILAGAMCAGISVVDVQDGQSIWRVWVALSVVLVVNGIAMLLHARKRDDSPLLSEAAPVLEPGGHAAKARS